MKVLLIGSGAREDAIATKISESKKLSAFYAIPGNPGIAQKAICIDMKIDDYDEIYHFVQEQEIDLVVIGPEDPLVHGLSDKLMSITKVFGPNQEASQLEGSKSFSKEFMNEFSIATANSVNVFSKEEAAFELKKMAFPHVIKADGLAGGKGVFITRNEQEDDEALQALFEDGAFQGATDVVVLEEFLEGPEISIFVLLDSKNVRFFSTAMDYKRAYDGDKGPNTGGMGAISPVKTLSKGEENQIREIINKTHKGIMKRKYLYRGVLFIGCIRTNKGIKVLEYNVRFGDPETQAMLVRFEGDLLEVLDAVASDQLESAKISFSKDESIIVNLVSAHYPKKTTERTNIEINEKKLDGISVFHGATKEDQRLYTTGGRVMSLVACAKTLDEARNRLYSATDAISFSGMRYRKDIGCSLENKEIF